jgi:hypothetical protein
MASREPEPRQNYDGARRHGGQGSLGTKAQTSLELILKLLDNSETQMSTLTPELYVRSTMH